MARNYKREYETYQGTEQQKKNRAARNKVRRQAIREGKAKVGDGMLVLVGDDKVRAGGVVVRRGIPVHESQPEDPRPARLSAPTIGIVVQTTAPVFVNDAAVGHYVDLLGRHRRVGVVPVVPAIPAARDGVVPFVLLANIVVGIHFGLLPGGAFRSRGVCGQPVPVVVAVRVFRYGQRAVL